MALKKEIPKIVPKKIEMSNKTTPGKIKIPKDLRILTFYLLFL